MQCTSDLRNKSTKKNRRRQSVDALFLYEAHIFRSEPKKRMETPQICHVCISKTRQKQCVKWKISRKSPQWNADFLSKSTLLSAHACRNVLLPAGRIPSLLTHSFTPHSLLPNRVNTTKPRVSFESRGLSCKMAATYSPAGVQYHRRGRA